VEAEVKSFKRCSKCRAMLYCGAECQAAHWKRTHKLECGGAWRIMPATSSSSFLTSFLDRLGTL